VSPDGRTIASGHSDGNLLFWDISDPENPVQLSELLYEQTELVNSVRFSPDGQTLASGSFDGTVLLWDVATRQPISRLHSASTSAINSISYLPDGDMLVSSTESGYIRKWDVSDLENPVQLEDSGMTGVGSLPTHLEYSREGNFLTLFSTVPTEYTQEEASLIVDAVNYLPLGPGQIVFEDPQGEFAVVQIYDAVLGDEIRLVDISTNRTLGQSIPGTYLAIAHPSRILAYRTLGEEPQSVINLRDLNTDQPVGNPIEGEFLALSPEGKALAYQSINEAGEASIVFHDMQKDAVINTIQLGSSYGTPFVSETGNVLAFTAYDETDGSTIINLLEVATGNFVRSPVQTSESREIYMLSADGRLLLYTGYDANGNQIIGVLDTFSGSNVGEQVAGYINIVREFGTIFAYETYENASGENHIHLIDTSTGEEFETLTGTYIDILKDGRTLLYADDGVNLFDITNRKHMGETIKGTYLGITRDGKTLATRPSDHTITLWNLEKTWPIGEPLGQELNQPSPVALSPDGNTIAWLDHDGIVMQDVLSGNILNEPFTDHSSSMLPGEDIVYSPDGRTAAVTASSTYTTTLWDLSRQEQIGESLPGVYVKYSQDGRYVAISDLSSSTTSVLDLVAKDLVSRSIPGITPSFRQDGQKLAVGDSITYSISLLNLETRQIEVEMPGEVPLFNSTGNLLAITNPSSNTTILYDTAANRLVGEEIPGQSVIFSAKGSYLSVADSNTETTTLVSIDQMQALKMIPGTNPEFSPDESLLIVGNIAANNTTIWDAKSQQQLGRPMPGYAPFFTSDSQAAVVLDYDGSFATLWDLKTYEQIGQEIEGDTFVPSPDGKVLAVGDYETYTIMLWDVKTQEPISEAITGESLVFSSNSSVAAVVNYNIGGAIVWDLRNKRAMGNPIQGSAFAFSPNGDLLAVEDYNNETTTVTLWGLKDRHEIGKVKGERVLFDPEGNYLSVNDYATNALSIWNVDELELRPALERPIPPTSLVFSPDSSRLASYAENSLIVRDLNTGTVSHLDTAELFDPIFKMGFNDDNSQFTALDVYGTKYTWDATSGVLLSGAEDEQLYSENFSSLAWFSPNGKYIVYEKEGFLQVWDLARNQSLPAKIPYVATIAFSPDGNLIATADLNGTIVLSSFPELDVMGILDSGLENVRVLGLVMEDTTNVRYLITQDESGKTQIWDWANRTEIGIPMTGNLQYLGSSVQNHTVVYVDGSDRLIKFKWDLTHKEWMGLLCPLARRNFSQEELANYFPDSSWPPAEDQLTCPGYPLGS
jgi:WD40 repeat protein